MNARKYDRRIEIWQTTDVSDGFGGFTVTDELLGSSWCYIGSGSKSSRRLNELGVTDIANTIIVKLRHRNDLIYSAVNQYLKYKDKKYMIQSIVDVDLDATEIEIIAVSNG